MFSSATTMQYDDVCDDVSSLQCDDALLLQCDGVASLQHDGVVSQ